MSALSELLDKDNWSNFAWYGERSLSLEVVPELEQEFNKLLAALEEAEKVIKFYGTPENWVNDHVDIGVGNMPIPETSECGHDMGRKASAWLSVHPAQQGGDDA